MLEPKEHHHGQRVVAGPIPAPFPYANIAVCNPSESGRTGSGSSSLVKLQVPGSNAKASRAGIHVFHPSMYTYGSTNLHGGEMLCTQAGGHRAFS